MAPCWSSTGPVLSSCTGPTRLGFTVEGGGPKYERFTVVPTEAGAGNKLQPGPGPIGPGPGPWAVLGFTAAAPTSAISAALYLSAIGPWNAGRGARSRGES